VVAGIIAVIGGIVYLVIESGKEAAPSNEAAQAVENDATWDGPGEYVNLPEVWKDGDTLAHYGANDGPNTNSHVTREVDYSGETSPNSSTGLPPVGGPHWGQGSCGEVPAEAPAFCGPVPWGVYREPWPAAALVHNMEHGGVIVWYNTGDQTVIDNLEDWVADLGDDGAFTVLTPYPDIPDDTVAMTAWSRRDVVPLAEVDEDRIKTFIRQLNCRFNPEGFNCGDMG
jgi:hypothetical protein